MVSARPSPARSAYKQQSLVLAEVKAFDRAGLRHVEATRVTDLAGVVCMEANQRLQPEPGAEAEVAALRALAALRLRVKKDTLPARVAEGLFIGGAGAARNLKALRKRGITHIVNAAPAVPCHFRDNPEGVFEYLALPLFDDPDADLLPHIEASNAFITSARARGGAVLVHCYAGQSRSAALVIAYLMKSQGLGLMDAWALTRAGRPCAQPNSGFLRQLALYGKRLAAAGGSSGSGACAPVASVAVEPADSAELALTQ
jgi:hypothetical protein